MLSLTIRGERIAMLQLIYCSVATTPMSATDLHALLEQSRDSNLRHDITGILVYDKGVFLQVIEGPDHEVARLSKNIRRDPRHTGFRQVHLATVGRREFGEWSMAFAAPQAGLCTVEGFLDLDDGLCGAGLVTTKAQQMLNMFPDGIADPVLGRDGGAAQFTVSMAPASHTTDARLDAASSQSYLAQLAHAIAIGLPDVSVCVEIAPADVISYNVRRNLMLGEAELF